MTRRPLARRTASAFAAASLLCLGLVGCGDDTGSADQAKDVSVLSGLGEGDEVDPGEFVDVVVEGGDASSTANVGINMSMGATGSMTGEGVVDYTGESPDMKMTMDLDAGDESLAYDMVTVDGVIYMSMDELTDGKYWKLDPADPDGLIAQMGMDEMLGQSDPMSAVRKMEPAIENVTYVGEGEVAGRDLDHYELTVDLAKSLEAAGSDLADFPDEVVAELPEFVTYDIWLDEKHRLAQLDMDYELVDEQMTMTMTLEDWGVDVDIEAPPADQVTEMPDLRQGA